MKLRVALLTTDNREDDKNYANSVPYFGAAPEALLQGFARISDVEVHVVCCSQQPMRAPEKLANNIWYHGLLVPKLGWLRTLYQGCIRATRRQLREVRPDIVHGQGTERDCAITAVLSGYPNVVTVHGIMREMARVLSARPGSFHWLTSVLENFALRRTGGVLCNSRFTQAMIRSRCRRTWLVSNALRERFLLESSFGTRSGTCTVLNVGTVCAYKRQNELLDVFEQLRKEGLDFHAEFLGLASRASPYASRFLNRIQNSTYLAYSGFKSLDELINTYDNSSALVHVSAIESFGLVVAEALSRNLKFFGFKSGGVPDIAENVEGAELFADGDWSSLKSALARWIRSGFPRPRFAANVMRERYHPLEIAQRHLEVYHTILRRDNQL